MNFLKDQTIRNLYPEVVFVRGEDAFDADENPVKYDNDVVEAKMLEFEAKQESAKQSSLDKLAKLGLTADDLKNILG
jgi:hypothetical protein